MLRIGEIVRGPHWPETVEIKKCEPVGGTYYVVEALGRTTRKFYEFMLEEYQLNLVERLSTQQEEAIIDPATLQRYLQYQVFAIQKAFSASRALGNQHVMPLPHQIAAVYDRMLQAPQVRFLLADDPGAGKTIMSGMLIRELQARGVVDHMLILVPPLVLLQWQQELREKFGLEFQVITRNTLRDANGRNPFEQHRCCLASMHWAAREDVKQYVRDASFDLIIVDEAHKMAAYTHGVKKRRTTRTRLYQLGESILRHAPHRLLLTATPHKGDRENFRHLMQLIDPDLFSHNEAEETLREQTNPFIIRRLKEQMVQFDGAPLFPPRTTKTIEFDLSPLELELYEEVTEYVRHNFNRAQNNGKTGTAFTMMLLQRRLSSSVEAIHLSLERRKQRLEDLLRNSLEEREKLQYEANSIDLEDFEDESSFERGEIETQLEGAVVSVDVEELQTELQVLEGLLRKTRYLRLSDVERKYLELENTLFGLNGLIHKGEKILIFTEASDTLHYLENRLKSRVPKIAKIVGSFSMDERRRQVELFRNELPIMLATDAGGESINLQFCNQMINYDIPWNPNKLEQRMGRIHRIGQKNEVFIFNLVAKNTREGDVLRHLFRKMEQMGEDLGENLVFDFIGQLLDNNGVSLAELMQECVLNRQHLDDLIAGIERILSAEHQRLLELAAAESLDDSGFDLPNMRREQTQRVLQKIPSRVYADFLKRALISRHVVIADKKDPFRIEKFPKSVRDFARRIGLPTEATSQPHLLTGQDYLANHAVELVQESHPLFELALDLTQQDLQKIAMERIEINYPTREELEVELYEISIVDGTSRELTKELIHVARRPNGEYLSLDPYWITGASFGEPAMLHALKPESNFIAQAIQNTLTLLTKIKEKREGQLNKKSQFLRKAFEVQYRDTLGRLNEYRAHNFENRNSALINQMNAQLIEIEERQSERLGEIDRERNIQPRPPKRLVQIVLKPNDWAGKRLFPSDWLPLVEQYEIEASRMNVQMLPAFGLVDFCSETEEGESRFIILTDDPLYQLTKEHQQDLGTLLGRTHVYLIRDGGLEDITKILV